MISPDIHDWHVPFTYCPSPKPAFAVTATSVWFSMANDLVSSSRTAGNVFSHAAHCDGVTTGWKMPELMSIQAAHPASGVCPGTVTVSAATYACAKAAGETRARHRARRIRCMSEEYPAWTRPHGF